MSTRRVINIVNFIRYDEPRVAMDLLQPVVEQMKLLSAAKLPATWLLQFDALVAGPYAQFLKANMPANHEVGLWFEINRMHCDAAGVPFHGADGLNWDYHAQASLSVGYTPDERRKLVDVAVSRFREIFGHAPRSVAAWYIDALTLDHFCSAHKITATANCKDQYGTDGYTLWGAPYAGAYYPSKQNAMVPASTPEQQIGVPLFRMLGSDPIHQYDLDLGEPLQRVLSLEPVYGNGGADPNWVKKYLDIIALSPALALSYAQAGQENSFGWEAMKTGYELQVAEFVRRRDANELGFECMGDTGAWFQKTFAATPPQATTALTDTLGGSRRSIWYHSKFYRANLLLQDDAIRIRDIHLFDQNYHERYLAETCKEHAAVFDTLPVLDGLQWSTKDHRAWGTPLLLRDGGIVHPLRAKSNPKVTEHGSVLVLEFPLDAGDGTLRVVFDDGAMRWTLFPSEPGFTLGLEFRWAPGVKVAFTGVADDKLEYQHNGFSYGVRVRNSNIERTRKGFMLKSAATEIELHFRA